MQKVASSKHETLANRLAGILTKLNSGYRLDVSRLAEEYEAHPRTIRRDFIRFEACNIPLQKEGTVYFLDPKYLGQLTFRDIQIFSQISGISHLYPKLDVSFLRELLDSRVYDAKGYSVEDASEFKHLFPVFSKAILNSQQIAFVYKGEPRIVEPYKLLHHHGSWYLAAVREGELRAYRLSQVEVTEHQHQLSGFKPDEKILKQLENENSIWFSNEKKIEVILNIHPTVASYFKQRALFPEQQIIKHLDNGGLLISTQISHYQQVLPLVRYWIPHVKILKPVGLQVEFEAALKSYLDEVI
ncbi:helix-turn-helix transcriptional regulator [Acinetobacter sp. ANC 4178]|uniref:helix-turn-helix transcriptional regulator n=1 Tax=Acinetobacter sp. ANC 4178 TaxID=2529839 RepID=UPI00103A3DE1|nr:WYL domain-containing protein [Acinetobacter sp. ANC 4178]TCB67509.1 WYL domain-containing protein [Acinetobacter sp. ANC 4178]